MQYLAEFGLLGVIPYALLLISMIDRSFATSVKGISTNNLVPLGMFVSLIQMSAHMYVFTALTGIQAWFIYALNVAAATADYTNNSRDSLIKFDN